MRVRTRYTSSGTRTGAQKARGVFFGRGSASTITLPGRPVLESEPGQRRLERGHQLLRRKQVVERRGAEERRHVRALAARRSRCRARPAAVAPPSPRSPPRSRRGTPRSAGASAPRSMPDSSSVIARTVGQPSSCTSARERSSISRSSGFRWVASSSLRASSSARRRVGIALVRLHDGGLPVRDRLAVQLHLEAGLEPRELGGELLDSLLDVALRRELEQRAAIPLAQAIDRLAAEQAPVTLVDRLDLEVVLEAGEVLVVLAVDGGQERLGLGPVLVHVSRLPA